MRYPKQIQSRKAKIAYILFRGLYTLGLGRQKVVGRGIGFIPEFGWLVVGLMYITSAKPTGLEVILLLIEGFGIMWVLGEIYYALKLDRIEQLINERRSTLLWDIYNKNVRKKR